MLEVYRLDLLLIPCLACLVYAVVDSSTRCLITLNAESRRFHSRVQRSLSFQPALRASCSQDVLAQRLFLLAQKFSMFYSAPINYFKEKFS